MDMPIGIAGLGRVWHFNPVPVPCRNPQLPPLGDQLLGPEMDSSLAPSLAASVGEVGEMRTPPPAGLRLGHQRSEEHTSELQSLMRISYAVFCLKKKKHTT